MINKWCQKLYFEQQLSAGAIVYSSERQGGLINKGTAHVIAYTCMWIQQALRYTTSLTEAETSA